jgi:hypothetical protein
VFVVESEVNHVEPVNRQAPEVDLDTGAKLLRSLSGDPAALVISLGADFADQHKVRRIGVEGGVDQLVGDVRPVELGGVDVVDTQLDGPAQHGERRVPIPGRPSDTRAG